ncbi:arylsulfatase B [Aplysia californica]|uniref:Arylsulfatase B n=1 Tax=Aplysia californica TaxID=6500 RepID=A0ABM1ABC6_APLCA|nr:arylsulfatase B [Aplysia californica]
MTMSRLSLCALVLSLCYDMTLGKPPHIVFIVADDFGWNDVGFNNPDIISPNIDALALNGIILNQSYVQPVCSPSRSAFMTGYYPFRMGLQHMVIWAQVPVCVPLNKTFLPEVMRSHGYATHAMGKWHLGMCNWKCTPTYRGFDSFFGYYGSREDYYSKINMKYFDFRNNTDVFLNAKGTYSTYQYTEAVQRLIASHNATRPLFLYFPFQSVHEPIMVPKHYTDLYPNVTSEGRRIFSGMVTAMDDTIGALVQALKDKEMYEDTVFFFTSDNGGWPARHGNNFPLRGSKITIWEGGTRVPAFIHSQKFVQKGVRFNGLMHAVDWFPTILQAAGIDYHDSNWDGLGQWQAIRLLSASPRSEFVYNLDNSTHPTQGRAAIRVGDFKLIEGFPGPYSDWYLPGQQGQGQNDASCATFDRADDLGCWQDGPEQMGKNWTLFKGLFNLRNDPYERENLYEARPDIVSQLRARMSYHYARMVPANYPPADPRGDPARWGGVWSPGWC